MKKDFKINTEIYSAKTIKQAIEDFKEVWEIGFKEGTLSVCWESDTDIEEVFNEFMNYVIWLYNESI